MGEFFNLRNKLAHTINDVNIKVDDISLETEGKNYLISDIFNHLNNFITSISSEMIKKSYTL